MKKEPKLQTNVFWGVNYPDWSFQPYYKNEEEVLHSQVLTAPSIDEMQNIMDILKAQKKFIRDTVDLTQELLGSDGKK